MDVVWQWIAVMLLGVRLFSLFLAHLVVFSFTAKLLRYLGLNGKI
jgi:hypothetical protein